MEITANAFRTIHSTTPGHSNCTLSKCHLHFVKKLTLNAATVAFADAVQRCTNFQRVQNTLTLLLISQRSRVEMSSMCSRSRSFRRRLLFFIRSQTHSRPTFASRPTNTSVLKLFPATPLQKLDRSSGPRVQVSAPSLHHFQ